MTGGDRTKRPLDERQQQLTMFRELCQYFNVLATARPLEEDCLHLLDVIEETRLQWLQAHNENLGLKAMLQSFETDNDHLRDEIRALKTEQTEMRGTIASLTRTKQCLQQDVDQLEHRMSRAYQLIRSDAPNLDEDKYSFMKIVNAQTRNGDGSSQTSRSTFGDADVDFDYTEDSQEEVSHLRFGRTWRRSSHSKRMAAGRTLKRSFGEAPIAEAEEALAPSSSKRANQHVLPKADSAHKRAARRRSFSEPRLMGASPPAVPIHPFLQPDSRSPQLRTWLSTGNLFTRRHTFTSKTMFKPESCDICRKRIRFAQPFMRCQDCKMTCHDEAECSEKAPVPCVPRAGATPMTGKKQSNRLADLVPAQQPMIPHVLIHCVTELERRGLDSIGLYRVPGTDKEIGDLLQRFLHQRGVPDLSQVTDPHVLTGCVKRFLLLLQDPLIPRSSRPDFLEATSQGGEERWKLLDRALTELPIPNRHTLAYLMLHWLNVMAAKDRNKMELGNMATLLGPSVVGYGSDTPSSQQALTDQPGQNTVMTALLQLPRTYWAKFIVVDNLPLILTPLSGNLAYPSPPMGSFLGAAAASGRPGVTPKSILKTQTLFRQPWR